MRHFEAAHPASRVSVLRAWLSARSNPLFALPCQAPTGWSRLIHEGKHDGFRILVRQDTKGVRLITRKGDNLIR